MPDRPAAGISTRGSIDRRPAGSTISGFYGRLADGCDGRQGADGGRSDVATTRRPLGTGERAAPERKRTRGFARRGIFRWAVSQSSEPSRTDRPILDLRNERPVARIGIDPAQKIRETCGAPHLAEATADLGKADPARKPVSIEGVPAVSDRQERKGRRDRFGRRPFTDRSAMGRSPRRRWRPGRGRDVAPASGAGRRTHSISRGRRYRAVRFRSKTRARLPRRGEAGRVDPSMSSKEWRARKDSNL